ncbi:MAG: hypothetical protein ACREKI_03880 [Gemmatimonadota bacterium]
MASRGTGRGGIARSGGGRRIMWNLSALSKSIEEFNRRGQVGPDHVRRLRPLLALPQAESTIRMFCRAQKGRHVVF